MCAGRDRAAPRTTLHAGSGRRDDPARPHARSFFERDPPAFEEPPQAGDADADPVPCKLGTQVGQGDVRLPLQGTQDHSGMGLDPARAAITARLLRSGITHPRQRMPADRARGAHPEAGSSLTTGRSVLNGFDYTPAKINRQRLGHACPPPPPARSLNQIMALLGIPVESVSSKNALMEKWAEYLGFGS